MRSGDKPVDEEDGAVFDAQGSRYITAKDIAEAAPLLMPNSTRLMEAQFREQFTPFLLDSDARKVPVQFEITVWFVGGITFDVERSLYFV